jgi:DNA-directed RNA polymerase specialized sigma24 family protein
VQQTAALLGIAQGTVKSQAARGLAALRVRAAHRQIEETP